MSQNQKFRLSLCDIMSFMYYQKVSQRAFMLLKCFSVNALVRTRSTRGVVAICVADADDVIELACYSICTNTLVQFQQATYSPQHIRIESLVLIALYLRYTLYNSIYTHSINVYSMLLSTKSCEPPVISPLLDFLQLCIGVHTIIHVYIQ